MKKLGIILLVLSLLLLGGCSGPFSANRDTESDSKNTTDATGKFAGKVPGAVDFGEHNNFSNTDLASVIEQMNKRLLEMQAEADLKSTSESHFSQSVSNPFTLLWMGLGMCLMVAAYIVWTKTTATGRAADVLAGKALYAAKDSVAVLGEFNEHLQEKLKATAPSSSEHQMLQNLETALVNLQHKVKDRAHVKANGLGRKVHL